MSLAAPDVLRVLIADDQADVLDALRLLLHPEGILTDAAQSPAAVLKALDEREYDALLMDLNYARDTTSGREGLDLISEVRTRDPHLPVLVMTGWATLDIAVEALRYGVRDFVQKPWENDQVVASVRARAEERRAARRRAATEARQCEEAREIQRSLLPHTLPSVAGWDLAARCEPAECVGGDTFDVIRLDEHRFGLSLGDVSGKGIPAALLASNLQAAVRAAAGAGLPPARLCAHVNRALCSSLSPGHFVTFFYATLDTTTGEVRYCNAGHLPPFVLRARGDAEFGVPAGSPGGAAVAVAGQGVEQS
jgi:FixJ family two-component response regulator